MLTYQDIIRENPEQVRTCSLREQRVNASRTAAVAYANAHGLVLPKGDWRWVSDATPLVAEVHALPTLHGRPRITNGVIVIIERGPEDLKWVHLESIESAVRQDRSNQRAKRDKVTIDYE